MWGFFAQMTAALDACHYRGPAPTGSRSAQAILHRDLKPENVFLDEHQNVKLGDFGLSKQISAQSFANTYVGTPYYMSPELASGQQYDIKSDIWALGCIVYELCALSPPFDAANQAELTRKIKLGMIPSLPRLYSRDLQDAVHAMLQLDHRRRPTTRQLLQLPLIKLACRTHQLAELHKSLESDREHVSAQLRAIEGREHALLDRERAMEDRERALHDREEALAAREAAIGDTASKDLLRQQADEQDYTLRQRELAVAMREEEVVTCQAELMRQYNEWYQGERVQLNEALEAQRLIVSEREAMITSLQNAAPPAEPTPGPVQGAAALAAAPDMPGTLPPEKKEPPSAVPTLERSCTDAATSLGVSSSQTTGRRMVRDRSQDMSEELRRRIAGGALALGSPRAPQTDDGWEDEPPVAASLARPRHPADLSDCSMRDASCMWRDAPVLSTPRRRTSLSTPRRAQNASQMNLPTSRTVPNLQVLPQEPQWHLCDESERPSPFLKRVSRVPLDSLHQSEADNSNASQLVSGPLKTRVRELRGGQENAPRRRLPTDVRRRRSSLLRPGTRTTNSSIPRMDANRARLPQSPSARSLRAPVPSARVR